ncbi:MAG: tyrosine-type recombinase/integrase [Anaerolineales bacterium]|nr:tyrosine-type recombinase/integrase [Anaerolineales bacterium]
MHISRAINLFIQDVCAGKNNKTPIAYRGKLWHLAQYWGDRDVERIELSDIKAFVRHLKNRETKRLGKKMVKEPLSPWTIRTVMGTVRYFVKWCNEEGIIPGNFHGKIKLPRVPKADPKAITPNDFEKLLTTAADYGEDWFRFRNVAILYTLRDTGSRVSGLATANIDYMDLEHGRLELIEKGDRCYTVHLSPVTIQAIREWLPYRESLDPQEQSLFITAKGTGMAPMGIYRMIYNMKNRSGIEGRANPHAFRHAFARDAIRNGADLSTVSQLMNHSSVAITAQYYARWNDDELHKAHRNYSPVTNGPVILPDKESCMAMDAPVMICDVSDRFVGETDTPQECASCGVPGARQRYFIGKLLGDRDVYMVTCDPLCAGILMAELVEAIPDAEF